MKKVIIEYSKDNISEHELEDAECYCPFCGGHSCVYVEVGYGDYYVGPDFYCTNCKHNFTYQSGGQYNDKFKFIIN